MGYVSEIYITPNISKHTQSLGISSSPDQQIQGHADDLSESHSPKQGVTWPYLQSLGEFQQPKQGDVTCIQLVVLCYKLQTWGSICFNHSIFLFHGTQTQRTHLDGGIDLRIGCGPFSLPSDYKGVEEDEKCLSSKRHIFCHATHMALTGKTPHFLSRGSQAGFSNHQVPSPASQLVKYDIIWYSMI